MLIKNINFILTEKKKEIAERRYWRKNKGQRICSLKRGKNKEEIKELNEISFAE